MTQQIAETGSTGQYEYPTHTKEVSESQPLKKTTCSFTSTLTEKQRMFGKVLVILLTVAGIYVGKGHVPNIEIACVEDKVFELLEPVTKFIMTPGNELWKDTLQTICSGLMDIIFFITIGYWFMKGNTSRYFYTLAVFYTVRALIQQIFFLPFPEMFYWDSPSFPSLVVPYGRGSDFFFSGHSGFLVICMNEWDKNGVKLIRNMIAAALVYTIWVLLVYRIHYSIDIFAGVIFADWIFDKIDKRRHKIDDFFARLACDFKDLFNEKITSFKYIFFMK